VLTLIEPFNPQTLPLKGISKREMRLPPQNTVRSSPALLDIYVTVALGLCCKESSVYAYHNQGTKDLRVSTSTERDFTQGVSPAAASSVSQLGRCKRGFSVFGFTCGSVPGIKLNSQLESSPADFVRNDSYWRFYSSTAMHFPPLEAEKTR
jgi:hypothetical protein